MISTLGLNAAQGRVQQAILDAASATGVDFAYLMNQARVESGFDPGAQARTSSATGLYQFIEQSWLGVVAKHGDAHGLGWAAVAIAHGADGRYRVADPGMRQAILDLRRDPQAAASMAAELASDNKAYLETRLGRAAEPVDLYLAHFLGAAGAVKFLKAHDADPSQAAVSFFPAAAQSNRSVFYGRDGGARTLDEVRSRFAAKFGGTDKPLLFRGGVGVGRVGSEMTERVSNPKGTTPNPSPEGEGLIKAQARLAYLMLASLGVSA